MIIKNLFDLIKIIESEDYQDQKADFIRDKRYLYRGQSNREYEIIPSIARYPNGNIGNQLCWFEKDIIESVKDAIPDVFNNDLTPIDLLSKLQHYGIPTRLLDITESPFVALYFACNKDYDKDGELIVFRDNNVKSAKSGIVNAIADTYNIPSYDFIEFLNLALERSYFAEERAIIKSKIDKNPKFAKKWIKECCDTNFFIHNAKLTKRQLLQLGKFILFPNSYKTTRDAYTFTSDIKPISKADNDIIKDILIIPANSKQNILKQLNNIGINRIYLFSDSIDIVCESIKEHYINRFVTN